MQEIQSLVAPTIDEKTQKVVLDTIYFGGGTPSLAPLSMLTAIVDAIRDSFDLADDLEFTMECDPGEQKYIKKCNNIRARIYIRFVLT